VEHEIALLEERLEDIGRQKPELSQAVARWDTIPGVDRVALLAEVGDNMAQFPTAEQLASWDALCPGNHESAGKTFARCNSSRESMVAPHGLSMRLGCRANQEHLLVLAVQTLSREARQEESRHRRGTYLIVIGYPLQKNQSNYDDLGGNYFDRIHSDGLKRYLVKRLQQVGHKVTLEPMGAV
jgi:hypothetical protein